MFNRLPSPSLAQPFFVLMLSFTLCTSGLLLPVYAANLSTPTQSATINEPKPVIQPTLNTAPADSYPRAAAAALPTPPSSSAREEIRGRVSQSYGQLPLSFEINSGQVDSRVKFLSRGGGYSLFLTPQEAVLALRIPTEMKSAATKAEKLASQASSPNSVLRMRLVGASASPRIEGLEELPGKTNYFIGSDRQKWRTHIANYGKVRYEEVYPNIDLVYYGNQRQLEYDMVVRPGGDPKAISFDFEGTEKLAIDGQGDLVLQLAGGEVRQRKPVIYQEVNGARQTIEGRYVIEGRSRVGIEVADYNKNLPLIIDPVLSYATYLGGSQQVSFGANDYAYAIAVDASGSAYVTGLATTQDFPLVHPFQSSANGAKPAFVTKLNPAGTAFEYSTYLGGTGGPASPGYGIAVDSSGSAYVTGITGSNDFPTTAGAYIEADPKDNDPAGGGFVTKFSPDGTSLEYSTYLASPTKPHVFAGPGCCDEVSAIAVNSAGEAYVTGYTNQPAFPTTPGAYHAAPADTQGKDTFVVKFNSTGSNLIYSTFLGGSGPLANAIYDNAYSMALDAAGNVYLTGFTNSTTFPTTPGAFQPKLYAPHGNAFVTKLNPNGTGLVYSTYLGGQYDRTKGYGIAIDSAGNAYIVGTTGAFVGGYVTSFPVTAGAFQPFNGGNAADGFLTKLNPTGTKLVYSTYLSARSDKGGVAVAVDKSGNAFAVASGGSIYPVNAVQISPNRSFNVQIIKFNPQGAALVYATYLDGSGSDTPTAIALDPSGNAYITGYTTSTDFPITPGAPQPTNHGDTNAFIAKIGSEPGDCPAIQINPAPLPNATRTLSYDQTLAVSGGTAPYSFQYYPGGNGLGSSFNFPSGMTLSSTGVISGTPTQSSYPYPIIIQVTDANGCIGLRPYLFTMNPTIQFLTPNPSTTEGGNAVSVTASLDLPALSGGAKVLLSSSNPAVVAVPSSITIPAGSTSKSFSITPAAVTTMTNVTLTATYPTGVMQTATVTVQPTALSSLTISPTSAVGGLQTSTGRVTLNGTAPSGGISVTLMSNNGAAMVPASVTIPAGAKSNTFTITTSTVTARQIVTLSASYGGVTQSAMMNVWPNWVKTLGLSPNPVVGGNPVTGTATLSAVDPQHNTVVMLSSSNPAVANPAVSSITIPAGQASGTFTINTTTVTAAKTVTISGVANGGTTRATLTVNP